MAKKTFSINNIYLLAIVAIVAIVVLVLNTGTSGEDVAVYDEDGNYVGMASNILRDVKEPLRFTSFVGDEEADVVAAFEAELERSGNAPDCPSNYCKCGTLCLPKDVNGECNCP